MYHPKDVPKISFQVRVPYFVAQCTKDHADTGACTNTLTKSNEMYQHGFFTQYSCHRSAPPPACTLQHTRLSSLFLPALSCSFNEICCGSDATAAASIPGTMFIMEVTTHAPAHPELRDNDPSDNDPSRRSDIETVSARGGYHWVTM